MMWGQRNENLLQAEHVLIVVSGGGNSTAEQIFLLQIVLYNNH